MFFMWRISTFLTLLIFLQACKHPLLIVGEGDIVDLNAGGFGCTLEVFSADVTACENDVRGDYFVNYAGVPNTGWRFSHWEGWCGPLSVDENCRIDVNASAVASWDEKHSDIPIPALTAVFSPIKNTTHDVVIVGAGSAGLYAAKTLQEFGYDVLIIEAAQRIGGRVKSQTLGDVRVDLGAEEHYMAAGENPVWPAVRQKYGDSIYALAYQGLDVYSMDGGRSTCWTSSTALHPCSVDSDVTAAGAFWQWYWKPGQHQDSASSLAEDVLHKYGVGFGHRAYHLYDAGFAGGSYATNLDKLGARSLALQSKEWDLSEQIRVVADKELGYADVLENIWWNDVVANNDLLLNNPVVSIDTRGDDVIVVDAAGDMHAARQVIVTVSLGVLQSEMIDFIPDLPSSTVTAYNAIGIDKGMKVPMRFSAPWWETESGKMAWLVTEGVAGACWPPSNYKLNATSHILMCYPMGENSVALNNIAVAAGGGVAGDAAITNAILKDLDNTFPQAPGQATQTYLEGFVQNWGADPYTLGVYSYPKVDTFKSRADNKRRDLQAPIAENRVFLAGEASNITHSATVVGALHEGERAANDVHVVNGNPNNPPDLPGY